MRLLKIGLAIGILLAGLSYAHGDEAEESEVIKGKVIKVEEVRPNQWAPVKALRIEVKSEANGKVNFWIPPACSDEIQVKRGDNVVISGITNPFSMIIANRIEDLSTGKTFVICGGPGRGVYGPGYGRRMMGPGMMQPGTPGYGPRPGQSQMGGN